MLCSACGLDKHPVYEPHPSGAIVEKCPCGQPHGAVRKAAVVEAQVAKVEPAWAKTLLIDQSSPISTASTPAPQKNGPPSLVDILATLKSRRDYIKSEITRLEALKREADTLDLMIYASEDKAKA